MQYQEMVDNVMKLGIIESERTAEEAIESVLGLLISRMQDSDARMLAGQFPAPLSFERLRARQSPVDISVGECMASIASQYDISQEEARELVQCVLHDIKDFVDEDVLIEVEDHLPFEWTATLIRA